MLARPFDRHGSTARSQSEAAHTEIEQNIISRVQGLADQNGWKMSQVALAWIQEKVSSPIVGFSSVQRLDEAMNIKGRVLKKGYVKYLEEPYAPQVVQDYL